MRILTAVSNYPQLSETYIAAEVAYLKRRGISVEIWATHEQMPGISPQVPVHRGTLAQAVQAFKPDIVHGHYLVFARNFAKALDGTNVPLTIRGHSFDFSTARAIDATQIPRIRRIYLFPHFARLVPHEKIASLPVAYDSTRYFPADQKDPKKVLRLAVGKKGKGLEDVFRVARLCPDHEFTLGIADVNDNPKFFEELEAMNRMSGGRVRLLRNIFWDEAARLTRESGIYLSTSDSGGHHFGMPVSVAEAMATGSLVLMRDTEGAMEYGKAAAFYYRTPEEAAAIIKKESRGQDWMEPSIRQALEYKDDRVLSRLVEDWTRILQGC
jgi:glycosyltransferase involved in cell wall biosynthesis